MNAENKQVSREVLLSFRDGV